MKKHAKKCIKMQKKSKNVLTFSGKCAIISLHPTGTRTEQTTKQKDRKNMKTKKVEIWLNGRFFEVAKNQAAAEIIVARLKRRDEYERSIGYRVPDFVYEIRPYSNH